MALPNRIKFQKFILQILDLYKELFLDVFRKKLQYNFPKMIGGVEGRLEFFPEKFIRHIGEKV